MSDDAMRFEQDVIAHLRQNCKFEFQGDYEFTAEPLTFYLDTFLCRLTLKAGSSFKSKKNSRTLTDDAEFRLLYRPKLGEDRLVPLSNDRSNVLLANRWFDLKIRDDHEKLDYVRFYYSVCRAEGRDKALNIPVTIDDVHVSPTVTPEQKIRCGRGHLALPGRAAANIASREVRGDRPISMAKTPRLCARAV